MEIFLVKYVYLLVQYTKNIFIIQLYFIKELLRLKFFVVNWWFCSRKRRHKM